MTVTSSSVVTAEPTQVVVESTPVDAAAFHAQRLRIAAAVAIAAVAVLNLADVVTTRMLLARGAIESNPLSSILLSGGRVELLKAGLVAALALRLLRRPATIAFAAAMWFAVG